TTSLFKDINPNPGSGSSPSNLIVFGSTLYFSANDGSNGAELWKSDGTPTGTAMLKDINPGPGSSSPTNLVVLRNTLFFAANDGTNGNELWKSDGTTAGTVLAQDINLAAGASSNPNPSAQAVIGGKLFFAANDTTDSRQL